MPSLFTHSSLHSTLPKRGSRGGNHLKGWMLDSSCHPPLPPAGGLPVCTGPDFKKKKKKDRGKSAGQASTRGRSFRHSRRFPERHSWFQRFSTFEFAPITVRC